MKIRIQENNIRFRLKENELQHLLLHEQLIEELKFSAIPGQQLQFCLQIGPTPDITIRVEELAEYRLTVFIPEAFAKQISEHEKEGIEKVIEGYEGTLVKVVVEIDGKCSHDRSGGDIEQSKPASFEAAENFPGIH